jgi:prepilin-type N-terminal cleavage/methylation domain-containing protein
MTLRQPRRAHDAGFTLIELIAAVAIFSVIFVVIGGIFMSLVRTHATVRDSTQAASSAQVTVTTIEVGIRNSINFALTNIGSDQFLVARTASSGSTLEWRCQAWYYNAADDTIRFLTTDGVAIDAPSSTEVAGWLVLAEGITPRNPATVFTKGGSELVLSFDSSIDGAPPVALESTVIPALNDPSETSCF